MKRSLGPLAAALVFLTCSPPSQDGESLGPLFEAEFQEAQEVYFSGRYDSATARLTRIRDRSREFRASNTAPLRAVAAEARAETWLGLASWRLGDYEMARTQGEAALALKLEHGLDGQLFRSYNALGLLAWNENRLSEAEDLFKQAISTAQDGNNPLEMASATGNLALVQTELGEFREARDGFLTMRSVASEMEEERIEGNALTNLGMLAIRVGEPDAALTYLEEARIRYDSIGYSTGVLSVLGQLGTAYMALGEPQRAFSVLDSALALSRRQGLRQEEAANLEILAELYREAGDVRRALSLYADARVINDELGLDLETGSDLRGEAEIQANLGNLYEAHSLATEAFHIHRRAGARLEELFDLLLLAEVQNEMKASAAVRSTLYRARSLAEELDARIAWTELALTEARVAEANGDHQSVLRQTRGVSADFAGGNFSAEWEAHLLRSKAFRSLGSADSALVAGRRALEAVERVRAGFGSSTLRTAYASEKVEAYSHLVSLLLDEGRIVEAFSVADGARARTLAEHLAVADLDGDSGSVAVEFRRGEGILRQINQLVESADYLEGFPPFERTRGQDAEIESLNQKIDSLRATYTEIMVRSSEADPASANLLGKSATAAGEVQEVLSENQLLVEYMVAPGDTLLIFLLTSGEIRFTRIQASAEDLTNRVRLARELIRQDPLRATRVGTILTGLFEILISPVLDAGLAPAGSELLIVPHGPLTYLPFAALLDGATHRYLAQDFFIRVLPSAGVLPALDKREARPAITPLDAQVLAPFPEHLPGTMEEATAVGREMRRTRKFLGKEATEKRLRRALETGDVVHVATHGSLNVRNPMFSRIEMAPGRGGTRDDGRLEVHELFGTPVESPLVFLSGCETGAGVSGTTVFDAGEDVATLSRAFLFAGARNVVATLWPVEDEGAAAFAQEFYEALARGSPTRALAAAQRAMMEREVTRSPFYWAAYQISGDDLRGGAVKTASSFVSQENSHRSAGGAVEQQ